MLVHAQTRKVVHVPGNRELSDHLKRTTIEYLVPATHKGHSFFRLEERARFKQ